VQVHDLRQQMNDVQWAAGEAADVQWELTTLGDDVRFIERTLDRVEAHLHGLVNGFAQGMVADGYRYSRYLRRRHLRRRDA
jgi:hypothetical protein